MKKLNLTESLQWIGAVFIIAGHSANAIGPQAYPWNIVAFFLGTIAFLAWTLRVANTPQMLVNIVALVLGGLGLFNAFI
jgi:hypothetical protein